MARARRPSRAPSPTDAVTLVRAATVARQGGSSTARLVNLTNHLRIKKRLSNDYLPDLSSNSDRVFGKPHSGCASKPGATESAVDIQNQAIDGIRHFLEHGDSGALAELAIAMSFSPRRKAFIDWCSKHTGLRWDIATQVFKKCRSAKSGTLAAAIKDPLKLPHDPAAGVRELQRLHDQAVAAVSHVLKCGDWTKVTGLVEAFSNRRRGEQLTRWFEQFGSFTDKSGRVAFRLRTPISAADFAAATSTPFFKLPIGGKTYPTYAARRPPAVATKCKVCGGPAMPGEDICYRDQSE
jgi:hypothetical protein